MWAEAATERVHVPFPSEWGQAWCQKHTGELWEPSWAHTYGSFPWLVMTGGCWSLSDAWQDAWPAHHRALVVLVPCSRVHQHCSHLLLEHHILSVAWAEHLLLLSPVLFRLSYHRPACYEVAVLGETREDRCCSRKAFSREKRKIDVLSRIKQSPPQLSDTWW